MRILSILLPLFLISGAVSNAAAGDIAKRVKARGFVRCGSVERPGLAKADGHGGWTGLEVDFCRAVAAAVLGAPERIEYHGYDTSKDFDAVRNQQDDVYFLTGSEINRQKLAGKVLPGPTVFVESNAVMAPANSASKHLDDLAGNSICFKIGSPAERDLNAHFDMIHKGWLRRGFTEDGEMCDAYNVQSCHAIAGEITTLAAVRLDPGVNHLSSRILPGGSGGLPCDSRHGNRRRQVGVNRRVDGAHAGQCGEAGNEVVCGGRGGNAGLGAGTGARQRLAKPRFICRRQLRRHLRAQSRQGFRAQAGSRP